MGACKLFVLYLRGNCFDKYKYFVPIHPRRHPLRVLQSSPASPSKFELFRLLNSTPHPPLRSQTMKSSVLIVTLLALVHAAPVVDTMYPYTGPAVPVGDWVDQTVNGNGKGFPRLVEPPAVTPSSSSPTNNINVISLAYLPTGMNIHFQTPFGLDAAPSVNWGTTSTSLDQLATGTSRTYVLFLFTSCDSAYVIRCTSC